MKDLTPEEAGRWLEAAPLPIQDAVTSAATGEIIEELGKKYSLHVDVIGLLYKLVSYMLVGYISPQEFLQELVAAGIKDADAQQIIKEINEKIFVPLQAKMRGGGERSAAPAVATAPVAIPPPVAPSARPSAPAAIPVAPPAVPVPPPVSPISTLRSPAPAVPAGALSSPPGQKILNRLTPNASIRPTPLPVPTPVRTPTPAASPPPIAAGSDQLAAALRTAGVPLKQASTPPAPPQAPMPSVVTPGAGYVERKRIVPVTATPTTPAPSPVATAAPTIPTVAPPPVTPPPRAAVQAAPPASVPAAEPAAAQPAPPIATYSIDPYRETPEEHER